MRVYHIGGFKAMVNLDIFVIAYWLVDLSRWIGMKVLSFNQA